MSYKRYIKARMGAGRVTDPKKAPKSFKKQIRPGTRNLKFSTQKNRPGAHPRIKGIYCSG